MPIMSASSRSAKRSITIKLFNKTNRVLRLEHASAATGAFGGGPSDEVKGNGSMEVTVENTQPGQGASYRLVYEIDGVSGSHDLTLTGENPWAGHSTYSEVLSGAATHQGIAVTGRGGSGDVGERVIEVSEFTRK